MRAAALIFFVLFFGAEVKNTTYAIDSHGTRPKRSPRHLRQIPDSFSLDVKPCSSSSSSVVRMNENEEMESVNYYFYFIFLFTPPVQ